MIIGPGVPAVPFVDAGEVQRIVDENIDALGSPLQRIDVKCLVDVIEQDAALALLPFEPVIRFVVDRAVCVAHLVTDVLHDVDLARVGPGISGAAALPVLAVLTRR